MARRVLRFSEVKSRDNTDTRQSRRFQGAEQDEAHVGTLKDSLENLRCPL